MTTADETLQQIKTRIDTETPDSITIRSVTFEGPVVVVYTPDVDEFAKRDRLVPDLASSLRKRLTIRPTPDALVPQSEAEATIRQTIPDEADVSNLTFDSDTGEVLIEATKPGLVIGRHGNTLDEIRAAVGWTPEVLRTPPMESSTVANVRNFLTQERAERRDVLERVGRKLHRPVDGEDEWVRLTTLGCCREVGRAAFLLSTPESRILIDCGDKPGAPGEVPYLQVPEALAAGPNSIDAVVLTHAHLDHSALIPTLYKYGYDGPIYTTEPTRDLMGLLQLDYLDVAAKQGRTPPYESSMVREALKHTIPIEYGNVTDIAPDIKLTMHNAGHILGSAVSHFHVGEGLYNVAFSGDIHYTDTRLLDGAVNDFPRVESLVLESTYGGRNDYQTDQEDSERHLKEVINRVVDRDGIVLIPAFAVGRSQELMLVLEDAMRRGEIPDLPVYLDGMIREATAIHTAYPDYLRASLRERILYEDDNPFMADQFQQVDGGDEMRQDIADDDPAIVLTTSGMLEGGPVMSWLRLLGSEGANALVFVGYQAEGTLGRQIQRGQDEITMTDTRDGRAERVSLQMGIETVDGFSGHADRQGLENFVRTMNPRPEKVLCVHGDEASTQQLSSALYQDFDMRTWAPKNLETFRFV
ncbi:beta-CASP ribonuclease aCPSF1 [Halobacteriales archaeon Cl-PHB]